MIANLVLQCTFLVGYHLISSVHQWNKLLIISIVYISQLKLIYYCYFLLQTSTKVASNKVSSKVSEMRWHGVFTHEAFD